MNNHNNDIERACVALSEQEILELFVAWHYEDDDKAFDHLVVSFQPLISWAIMPWSRQVPDLEEDLVQGGNVSMLQALQSWKVSGGYKLSTWVVQYIRRDAQRLCESYQKHDLGVSYEDWVTSLESSERESEELNIRYPFWTDPADIDNLTVDESELPAHNDLDKAIDCLPGGHKEIIFSRYFLDLSLQEIANIQGVTRQTVAKLHQEAVKELLDKLH